MGVGWCGEISAPTPSLIADLPTFFGNSYSVVKGFTDRMINQLDYAEAINARITLPLNFALGEERNLLAKIITYRWTVE